MKKTTYIKRVDETKQVADGILTTVTFYEKRRKNYTFQSKHCSIALNQKLAKLKLPKKKRKK